MSAAIRLLAGACIGMFASLFVFYSFDPPPAPPFAGQSFPPDFLTIAGLLNEEGSEAVVRAAAGAVSGAAIALVLTRAGLIAFLLAFANPVLAFAFLRGAGAALFFAAIAIVASAVAALAFRRNHGAAAATATALAGAPLISAGIIALYPLLFASLPLLSPWGVSPRRLGGFLTAVWCPFVMTCLSFGYLYWLVGAPDAPLADFMSGWNQTFSREGMLIAGGASLLALAARSSSPLAAAGAFAAGGAALYAGLPGAGV